MWNYIAKAFSNRRHERIAEEAFQRGRETLNCAFPEPWIDETGEPRTLTEKQRYEHALSHFSIAVEHRGIHKDYSWRGVTRLDYSDLTSQNRTTILACSVRDLEKALAIAPTHDASDHAWLAIAKTELADELTEREAKILHLTQAYEHFTIALNIEENSFDQYWAGINRQSAADEEYDIFERKALLKTALAHLERSYELDPDDTTLEDIAEVKDDLSYAS